MIDKFYSVKKATPWFAVFSGVFFVFLQVSLFALFFFLDVTIDVIIIDVMIAFIFHVFWCFHVFCNTSAMGLRECFLLSGVFSWHCFPTFDACTIKTCFFFRVPWEPTVQPQWQQGLIMWLKTKFWSSCLFESHSNSET